MNQQQDSPEDFEVGAVEPLDSATSGKAAKARMQDQAGYVEAVLLDAQRKGEFDNLPGAGKPIEGLGGDHDPEWWLKKLVEREELVVLPPSVQLRYDDAELDTLMDAAANADEARALVEEFNARVLAARYGAPSAIPLITQTRDVETAMAAWEQRRSARAAQRRATRPTEEPARRRRWWRSN